MILLIVLATLKYSSQVMSPLNKFFSVFKYEYINTSETVRTNELEAIYSCTSIETHDKESSSLFGEAGELSTATKLYYLGFDVNGHFISDVTNLLNTVRYDVQANTQWIAWERHNRSLSRTPRTSTTAQLKTITMATPPTPVAAPPPPQPVFAAPPPPVQPVPAAGQQPGAGGPQQAGNAAAPHGMFLPPNQPRPQADFTPGLRTTRATRLALQGRELDKLRSSVVEALPASFKHTIPTKGFQALEDCYTLSTRINMLKSRLNSFQMTPVFMIYRDIYPMSHPDPNVRGYIIGNGNPINVLASPSEVTVNQVCASNQFWRRFGSDQTYLQDLDWSDALLENSCEDSLRDQVHERTNGIDPDNQGGPLFYKVMMDIVTNVAPETIETLVQSLRALDLRHESFPGEDVEYANKLIRGVLGRLSDVNAVPGDIMRVLCNIYQTSSTDEYNAMFQNYLNMKLLGVPNLQIVNYHDLISFAEDHYLEYNARGTWCGASKRKNPKGSAFMAGDNKAPPEIQCHNCKGNHYARDCPNRPDDKPKNPFRTPPGPNEPKKKTFKNSDGTSNERKWCQKCNLWTKGPNAHFTEGHKTKAEIAAERAAAAATTEAGSTDQAPAVAPPVTAAPAITAGGYQAAAQNAVNIADGLLQPSSGSPADV